MKLIFSPNAAKQREKLPAEINKKFFKQTSFLLDNSKHPSLRARKMSGSEIFEARIDRKYRFCYQIEDDEIMVLTVGPHDTGLGKK